MHYRRDIDGLRALAVLPVVSFHAGVPGFSGGFSGVDVFFVISGYLITALISGEIRQGRFSIVEFYERRVRRIFPALFLVLSVSSVVATWLLLPSQFNEFAKSVFATVFFSSNVLFWQETGYFAAPASQQPLLHTWSLAVEEQFYVVFPLLLLAIHRWGKGRWIAWLAPMAVVSFLASAWGVTHAASATFYLAPTRAWELLLGSLLALNALPRMPNRAWTEILSTAGLALIAWGVFSLSADSPFPGANALYPSLGAALVIYAGEASPTLTSRLLETRPLVFVGLISYSLYLWHWPLLVFAPIWNIFDLTWMQTVAIVGLSFVAAILSWKFVETPFRRRRGGMLQRRELFLAAATTASVLVVFSAHGYMTHGWPSRLPADSTEIAAYSASKNPRRDECLVTPDHPVPTNLVCDYGAPVPASYALWGDSHADALIAGIGKVAKRHNKALKFFGFSGCPPVLDVNRSDAEYAYCLNDNLRAMNYILGPNGIDTVILVGRYAAYVNGRTAALGPAERGERLPPYITDASGAISSLEGRRALLGEALGRTVDTLVAAGKRVVLVYPIPEVGYDVPLVLARLALERQPLKSFTRPFSDYEKRQALAFETLDGVGQSQQVVRIYPHKRLCDAKECIVFADGKPLYRDDDHLSLAGADFIAPLFEPVFEEATAMNGITKP